MAAKQGDANARYDLACLLKETGREKESKKYCKPAATCCGAKQGITDD